MTAPVEPGTRASSPQPTATAISPLTVLRDQRKVCLVAVALAVASFWVLGPMGEWTLAACFSAGIGLAVFNHLATEWSLLRIIAKEAEPSRRQMAVSTIVRLATLSALAVGIAALFWPDGIVLLFGLALFRLIALVMTTLPVLKELKKV